MADSIVKGNVNIPPEYQVRLTYPTQNGGTATVLAPLPEQVQFGIQAGYEPVPGVGSTGGKTSMAVGAVAKLSGSSDFASLVLGTSAQLWGGKEYLTIDVPFHFHAFEDPQKEIGDLSRDMLLLAAPKLLANGMLAPPSVDPITALKAAISSKIDDFGVILEIGTFLRMSQLIITAVSPQYEMHMAKAQSRGSSPMEVTLAISFKTYFAVTDVYIETMFKSASGRALSSGNPVVASMGLANKAATGLLEKGQELYQKAANAWNGERTGTGVPVSEIKNGILAVENTR